MTNFTNKKYLEKFMIIEELAIGCLENSKNEFLNLLNTKLEVSLIV